MQRSVINHAYRSALACFERHLWALPPRAAWDITDFGLGDFARHGLTLINLSSQPEYCEKLMYAVRGQTTPCHAHRLKKEDIICRAGELMIQLWPAAPESGAALSPVAEVLINGAARALPTGQPFALPAGWRVTLRPGVWHAFWPASAECILGEVSTANDDAHDNLFLDPEVGRFPDIEEDAAAEVRLVSEP